MKRLSFLLLLISNNCIGQVITSRTIPVQQPIVNKPQHDPPETINRYAAVLAFNICTNTITVSNATEFNSGDTVLMIQMKGAIIDTSNTAAFGTILDYGNAGNYEFNFISAKSGNELTFLNKLTRTYDIPDGIVQLVRVPKYKAANFSGGLVPLAWDGATGGIICVYATNSINSVENIDATNRGFRGGAGYNATSSSCNQNNYYYPASSQYAAFRGESIGSVSQNMIKGKGNLGGGGGGGNSHNSGGGGGANGGAGGHGGYQSDSCNAVPFDNGGIGGKSLVYNSTVNKIFMGSGGGAGHIDNANSYAAGGGNGGGIIIIITPDLEMLGESIISDGNIGEYCTSVNCNDGMGAGGAGGTILLSINQSISSLNITANGGPGANMSGAIVPGGRAGPGGGGGGGVLISNGNSLPANVTFDAFGGLNGVISQDAGNNWGAMPGSSGINLFNLVLPYDTVLFKPNIDSVRIDTSFNYCNNILFKGLGYINTYPVSTWQWSFGDGATANTQNAIHNYNAVGIYPVKLIVTDVNGCKDSITSMVNSAGPMLANAGADSTLCVSGQTSIRLNGSGTGTYLWQPAALLNNNTLQNPIATISTTTDFYLTVSNGAGCSAIDTVTITINQNPVVKTFADTSICKNATLILSANGALNYLWSPGIYVSDSTIANPRFLDSVSRTLIITGTAINGCKASDTININVKVPVVFIAPPGKSICAGSSVQLNGNNGNGFQYSWSPPLYLSNPNIINPIANPPFTMPYTVIVKDNTCNYDSSFVVIILVTPIPVIKATKSNDVDCTMPTTRLLASGALQYTWLPAATLNNSQVSNPIANPRVTTTYIVTGSNNGCVSNDTVTVLVSRNGGLELPNSFTPNNDGLNDCFGIKYPLGVQELNFVIYNYMGQKVFETNNPSVCWNGTFGGKRANTGNYVYYLKANTTCGPVEIYGHVILIR